MDQLEQARTLVESYSRQQARILAALLRVLFALWGTFPHWGDADMERAWVAKSAVTVDIALARIRRLARSHALAQLDLIDARPEVLPDLVDTYDRGGTPIVEVYRRPARERAYVERKKRSEGAPPEEATIAAQKAFIERLEQIVTDDVMLTAREEAQKVTWSSKKVIGYRRVLHPEFSETGPCGLCIVASSRLYSVSELMPLHANCKCTVSPVTATQDLGLRLNRDDLNAIYNAAGGTDAKQLTQLRIKTVDHGEIGSMLLRSNGKWVDPAEVARRSERVAARRSSEYTPQTAATTQTNWRAMKKTSERAVRYLLNAKSRGTNIVDMGAGPREVKDLDVAIQYHRDLIARAARHAA